MTKTLALLALLLAACAVEAETDVEETSETESELDISVTLCTNHDAYTFQCCVNGSFPDAAGLNTCCPDGTKQAYDAALGRNTCGAVPGEYVAEDTSPIGSDGDQWVRWTAGNYWYLKSDWQRWGHPIFKRAAAAIDLAPSYTGNGQYYGNVTRRYRNGSTQTPYYKYYNSTSYYRYGTYLYSVAFTSTYYSAVVL
jgi:hypothetical protein